MSYQNWACYGWMLPATLENAKRLGINDEQLKRILGEPESDDNIEEWWLEAFSQAGYDNIEFVGQLGKKLFAVWTIHISCDDELDSEMDANIDTYFSFEFDELYKPTALHGRLEKIGMKHCTWVSGG